MYINLYIYICITNIYIYISYETPIAMALFIFPSHGSAGAPGPCAWPRASPSPPRIAFRGSARPRASEAGDPPTAVGSAGRKHGW